MSMDEISPELDVLVEIPRGCRNKYEWDPEKRMIRLDRVLYSSVHYPTDYGMAPETQAEDGDPLDVLVVVEEPTFPGCLVRARAIGTLDMRDEKGIDHKILAVPTGDPRFDQVHSLEDLPSHWLREIETFFATYKTLEGVQTEVLGWHGLDEALTVIAEARRRYLAGLHS
jgi:inorganic pyrophosphatase